MKPKIILSLLIYGGLLSQLKAQPFPVETLLNSGPDSNRVIYSILADGYTSGELNNFISDANSVLNDVFAQTPYTQYKSFFNVYGIKVPSNQSGGKHPNTASDCGGVPYISADPYFGSTFDAYGIHRLLDAQNYSTIQSVLATNTPSYNQALVQVNTSIYGGAGGQYATYSMAPSASGLMIHEVGHSFSDLADEYWPGQVYAAGNLNKPNFSSDWNPVTVKWKNWSGSNGISTYSHTVAGYYKPHQNCKMQYLAGNFCSVCVEAHIDKIYSLVTPIDAKTPNTATVPFDGTPLNFALTLNKPLPNTLDVKWSLNGTPVGTEDAENITLTSTEITTNSMILTATVTDETDMSRHMNSGDYVFTVSWTIDTTLSVDTIEPTIERFFYKVYPNPANKELFISYKSTKQQDMQIIIYDTLGKKVFTKKAQVQVGNDDININTSDMASGIYLVSLKTDLFARTFKFIKE